MIDPSALLAAGGLPPLARDIAVCLAAAVIFAALCERLRLPHALGFIVAGLVVGPYGTELVHEPDDIRVMAELGVVLLLFLIGVELDIAALVQRGRALVVAGLLQVPLTIGAIMGGWWWVGSDLDGSGVAIGYLAIACAFSSTLLVVKALERRGPTGTLGALCIGLLLAQDLWALLILAAQPAGFTEPHGLLAPLAGTVLLAGLALGPGRRLVATMVERVHEHPELFGLSALGWCLGGVLIADSLEHLALAAGSPIPLSSSAGMGAFIAGVTLASVPSARLVLHRLVGLRDVFIVLFFVGLGMKIPWPIDPSHLAGASMVVVTMVTVRALILYPLLRLTRTPRSTAAAVTAQMMQLSEFALVIVYVGHELGHIGADIVTVVLLGFMITAGLNPLWSAWARRLDRRSTARRPVIENADGQGERFTEARPMFHAHPLGEPL